MRSPRRQYDRAAQRRPRVRDIHRESEAPSDVSVRRRQQCGSGPNNCCCDKPSDTTNNNRPSAGQSNDSRVLQSKDCANSAIRRAKSRRLPAAKWSGRVRRHYRDEKYLRDNESALDHVIDSKLCGEVCVAEPGEKNQRQQKSVVHHAMKRIIGFKRRAQLTDGGREDQVIEQLGPAGTSNVPFICGPELRLAEKSRLD